ncbi:MAG: MarR family transcriptional regulator [Actinophytocola sp.]|uniref:MarR family winged helix-turn-helix transcriptional regulator n=1 Tax=Actinophytocola sp. TaxID=1872138 RepID=UPI003C746C7D
MTADDLKLEKQVCFALYAASRAVTSLYRPALDALGLTYPQYLVMIVLWERGPVLVKDLGQALDLDSGTLSPLLKRLDTAGLVRRQRCAEDERAVRIHLTGEGAALRDRATGLPRKLSGATGMTLKDLEDLRENLVRLTEELTAQQD